MSSSEDDGQRSWRSSVTTSVPSDIISRPPTVDRVVARPEGVGFRPGFLAGRVREKATQSPARATAGMYSGRLSGARSGALVSSMLDFEQDPPAVVGGVTAQTSALSQSSLISHGMTVETAAFQGSMPPASSGVVASAVCTTSYVGSGSVPGVPPLFEHPVIDVLAPTSDLDVSVSRHSSRSRKRGAASTCTPVQSKKSKKKGTSVTKKKSKKRAVSSPSDAALLTLFKAFAQQQGWALPSGASAPVCDQAVLGVTPPGVSPPLALPDLAVAAPVVVNQPTGCDFQRPRVLPPAALGAPPGEETVVDPWSYPVGPPSGAESVSQVSISSETSSVTGSAESQSHSQLGVEAKALLEKYLPEVYSPVPVVEAPSSLLFRQQSSDVGIPLTADFRDEYDRIGLSPRTRKPLVRGRQFRFTDEVGSDFFKAKKFSPEILGVGQRLRASNPLTSKPFKDTDRYLSCLSEGVRSSMRLCAYQGSLLSLRARAAELEVSEADLLIIDDILLSLAGLLWSQLSESAVTVTHRRRELALSALGVREADVPSVLRDVPSRGPFLFGGQFAQVFQKEIDSRKQVADLAEGFRRPQKPASRSGRALVVPRGQGQQRRVTVSVPPPTSSQPPRRGGSGGRGGGHSNRGQRGVPRGRTFSAATSRRL